MKPQIGKMIVANAPAITNGKMIVNAWSLHDSLVGSVCCRTLQRRDAVKQISVLRAILRQRGYLVVWQGDHHPRFAVGHVTAQLVEGFNLGLFAVREQTTKQDFLEQQLLSKKLEPKHWKHTSPTAHLKANMKHHPIFWRVTRTRKKP